MVSRSCCQPKRGESQLHNCLPHSLTRCLWFLIISAVYTLETVFWVKIKDHKCNICSSKVVWEVKICLLFVKLWYLSWPAVSQMTSSVPMPFVSTCASNMSIPRVDLWFEIDPVVPELDTVKLVRTAAYLTNIASRDWSFPHLAVSFLSYSNIRSLLSLFATL